MPQVIPGYTTENISSTVVNNDTAINAEISAKEADGWIVVSLNVSGSDMVILFTRTIAAS